MTRLRRRLARWLWDAADAINPPHPGYDTETERGWEISWYFETDEAEANAIFDRMSDATCGVDHHATEPCPGPAFVGGMHPADPENWS